MKPSNLVWFSLILLTSLGCSSSSGLPVTPVLTGQIDSPSGHIIFGTWDLVFNLETKSVEAAQNREGLKHYDISSFLVPPPCSDCLKIEILSVDYVDHLLVFNVTVKNPFPKLSAHNVRGIIMSDDPNHDLINADGYTSIWDTHSPKHINPYLGFPQATTADPYPLFSGGASHQRQFNLKFGDPPQFIKIHYKIDASHPGEPEEPALIADMSMQGSVYPDDGYGMFQLKAFDFNQAIQSVTVDLTPLMGQVVTMDGWDGLNWNCMVSDLKYAPAGEYRCLVTARSYSAPTIPLYHYFTFVVDYKTPKVPYAYFTHQSPPLFAGQNVKFDATPSDGIISTYYWDFAGQPESTPEPIIEHIFDNSGQFSVTLTVEGPGGTSSPYSHDVEIQPAPSMNWTEVTPWDLNFSPCDIAVDGNYAYVAGGWNGLVIFDVSNASNPVMIKKVPSTGGLMELEIDAGYVYAVSLLNQDDPWNATGIEIFDVTSVDSAHQVYVWQDPVAGIYGIEVEDGKAYIDQCPNMMTGIFSIYDVGDPTCPMLISSIETSFQGAEEITVTGGYAYCASGMDLGIVDVDPVDSPVEVKNVPVCDTTYFGGIAISGGYAYLSSYDQGYLIHIVDVDPVADASVVYKSPEFANYGSDLIVYGKYLYVANSDYDFSACGILVYDISNPGKPVKKAILDPGHKDRIFASSGNYIYTSDGCNLRSLQMTSPTQAQPLGDVETPWWVSPFILDGDYLYMNNVDDLHFYVWNIANPEAISFVKRTDDYLGGDGGVWDDNNSFFSRCFVMRIADLSIPGNPTEAGHVTLESSIELGTMLGDYIYGITVYDELMIVDISNPAVPVVKSVYEGYGTSAHDIEAYGDYVYLAAGESGAGVAIVDVSNPTAPELIGNFATDLEYVYVTSLYDHYIYVRAGAYDNILIYDLTNPESPVLVGEIPNSASGRPIVVRGKYLYAEYGGCAMIYDLSDPVAPIIAGMIPGIDYVRWMEIDKKGYAYVLDGTGLRIFKPI